MTAPLNRPFAPHLSRPARFERDCFSYDVASVEIWFMHREAQSFGVGADLGLQLWSDDYGLAFAFKPPASAWSLVCGIAEGRYDQCSAGFTFGAATKQREGGITLDSISHAVLDEITICPRGACPGAVCWHAGHGPRSLPPHAAVLLSTWELGRERAQQAA